MLAQNNTFFSLYDRKMNKPVQLFYATEDERIYFPDEER